MNRSIAVLVAFIALVAPASAGDDHVDLDVLTRIRDEGFRRSQVMAHAAYLCDVIGPRLTSSPAALAANEWTRQRFESFGLANAHLESWGPFGRGWSLERSSVRMLTPTLTPLWALARAWSPGTGGTKRGKAVFANIDDEDDFKAWKGKLKGAVVLLSAAAPIQEERDKPELKRYSEPELAELGRYEIPTERDPEAARERSVKRRQFRSSLRAFLAEEDALAAFISSHSPGLLVGGGDSWRKDDVRGVPSFVLMPEQYNRLVRLVERKLEVELEVDLEVRFHDDLMGRNTVAEIPGSDKADELVMAGAHLDSWHAGTGATDDGAGVSVVLEAARILRSLGITPRRTIRFALWTGEEQTLGGSDAYVKAHFGGRGDPADPDEKELAVDLQRRPGALELKPGHEKLSGYFNLDNGTGRIRGVYLQESAAVGPIFESWMKPLHDLGVSQLTMRNTDDTDHDSFETAGLPAFQFIQDDVEYSSRTWHTHLDVYDKLKRDDLMQASVVMASFLWNAANREERLPRKPLPKP